MRTKNRTPLWNGLKSICGGLGLVLIGWLGVALSQPQGWATPPALEVVSVEEDWELVISEPDANSTAPQVSCVISPHGNTTGLYSVLELNHRSQPDYNSGGMQLQVWNGEGLVETRNHNSNQALNTNGESILWTQRMAIENGNFVWTVANGSSATWGDFGGTALQIKVTSPNASLNTYSPQHSQSQSGISFAGNRVQSLKLKRVRYYSATGLISEDATERVVYPKQQ